MFQPFSEEAPRPPELFEIFPSLSVEGIHLARRPLLGRDLLHVDEALLLDPDEQGVDGALGDAGEALPPQPRRDLVAVRGPHAQDRQDDALQRALEHLRHLLAHGHHLGLLSDTDYWYIVTLNSGGARAAQPASPIFFLDRLPSSLRYRGRDPAPTGRRARWAGTVSWRGAARPLGGWRGPMPMPRFRWPTSPPLWLRRIWSCWGPRPTYWAVWRIAWGRCSAPSSCMPRAAISGGPHGARSGWRSTWAARERWRRPEAGWPGPTGSWSTSRRTAPSAACCCCRWRCSTSWPMATRPRRSWRHGRPGSAGELATPTWLRWRCRFRAAPWCGWAGWVRPWPRSTRPWWRWSPASSPRWWSAPSTAQCWRAARRFWSGGAPGSGP